jgi:MFS family permease
MVAMPIGGKLGDAMGPRKLVLGGLAFLFLGNIALTQVGSDPSNWWLALSGVPRGLGMGLAFPSLLGSAYRTLSRAAIPKASTTITIMQRVGGAVGIAVFAVVLQHGLDAGTHPSDAFATTFWWVLGSTVLALIPALLLPNSPAPAEAPVADATAEAAVA